ncbi:MAG: hypothetical protein KatS3mg105_4030 [Gemmatales bacterium]|nr:MAG: hypothetical protein KatS3mg105_4030 [Gemmatales bacterium]
MKERPALYLEDSCEALEKAFDTFLAVNVPAAIRNERLLSFLAQFDFWLSEVDRLMRLFETFEKRSKAWTSDKEMVDGFKEKNIQLNKTAGNLLQKRRVRPKGGTQIIAPIARLQRVIGKWNLLLELTQQTLLGEPAEGHDSFDLSRFRKKVPS